ncbi:MAG TPA: YCF48-related protein [Candidatus Dormibacteraeota bacterium]|nr:YCF48-related protein [Candidatus Dormibacteraeota bacterium]
MNSSSWYSQTTPVETHLHGIFAYDGCHAWAVGEETEGTNSQATIVATENGGKTWKTLSFPQGTAVNTTMNRIVFTSKDKGYAAGENSDTQQSIKPSFLRTTNGGETWTDLSANLPPEAFNGQYNDIEGLAAKGDDVWVAISMYDYVASVSSGVLLHSDNKGKSWTVVVTNNHVGFSSVAMADEKHGWATSDDHSLWRTTDGSTWNVVATTQYSAEQIAVVSKSKAVIVEDSGVIEYTNDGSTLYTATVPAQVNGNDFTDVAIGDDGKGYATGEFNGYLLATKNSGRTWTWESANNANPNTYNGVTVAKDTNFAWVTGEGGAIQANTRSSKSC